MRSLDRDIAFKLLAFVLRPAVRFCVRHSLRLQDIIEVSKALLVHAAMEELKNQGLRANNSRISVMTGVHRRDIGSIEQGLSTQGYTKDLVTKVMGAWQTDKRYCTANGSPRVLTYQGNDSEFDRLVYSISTDVNPAAVLAELERSGSVEKRRLGVTLVKGSFIPKGDIQSGFKLASDDADDLTRSVEENLLEEPSLTNLHARTQFDNVRPGGVEEIKLWFLKEGHRLHLNARKFISRYDQDVNPDPKFEGKGVRVVLGTFSYVDD